MQPKSATAAETQEAISHSTPPNHAATATPEAQLLSQSMQDNIHAIHKVASLVPSLRVLIGLSITSIIILGLYYGRDLLIPLALATLFGFLLNPLVSWLKYKGIPRIVSSLLVISVTLGILLSGAVYLRLPLCTLRKEITT